MNKNIATPREKEILNAIIQYIEKNQYPPTVREIGGMVGLKSTASVQRHIANMVDKGLIECGEIGAPRAIRVPGYKFVREEV